MKNRKSKKIVIVLIVLIILVGGLGFFGYQYAERSMLYPLKYQDILLTYSKEYDLDPNFVAAVICTESHFDTQAVSNVGAVGLMQIMPATGEWIAEKLGEDGFCQEKLYEPEVSIRYGCWFLHYLKEKYSGDTTVMLAGYNAGIGNVAKWLENTEYSANGKTLDEIPSSETREYVKKVNTAYEKYKTIYDLQK